MTPDEQIAYLREWGNRNLVATLPCILAVCDLAERATVTPDVEAVIEAGKRLRVMLEAFHYGPACRYPAVTCHPCEADEQWTAALDALKAQP